MSSSLVMMACRPEPAGTGDFASSLACASAPPGASARNRARGMIVGKVSLVFISACLVRCHVLCLLRPRKARTGIAPVFHQGRRPPPRESLTLFGLGPKFV